MLENIRIVLVHTSHPGNIGASARAMKTMGLTELYLVAPAHFPDHKADEMASGACDILKNATLCSSLSDAIADCHFVVGSSARIRTVPWPLLNPRELGQTLAEKKTSKIAIVFGREQSGLTNEELEQCHVHVQIPANPAYQSLNLSAAVQVIAYELRMHLLETKATTKWDYRLATTQELEGFFCHLKQILVQIDFLKLNAPRKLMTRLRRFFLRAQPDTMEMNILRGFLTAIKTALPQKEQK